MRRLLLVLAAVLLLAAPAGAAANLPLRYVSQDASTITLGWDVPSGANSYTFWVQGVRVSNTQDGSRSTVRFAKVPGCDQECYTVVANTELARGSYPQPVTPPPAGNVYISPSGSDSNACTQAAPCRTLQAGYAAAKDGDTISVAAGTYPGGTLTGSKAVTFSASGAKTTERLELDSLKNATIDGLTSTVRGEDDWSLRITGSSANLTLRNVSGSHFDLADCSSNIVMQGGSWGGYSGRPWAGDTSIGGDASQACGIVKNITLDGVTFHDVQYGPSSGWGGAHPDCLESHGAFVNLTIRNSTFERCGNTFIGTYLDWGNFDGLLIENNTFFQTSDDTYYGVQLGYKPGKTCANLVFRNNRYDPNAPNAAYAYAPPLIDDCADTGTGSVTQVYGNTFRAGPGPGQCAGDWHDNIFTIADTAC